MWKSLSNEWSYFRPVCYLNCCSNLIWLNRFQSKCVILKWRSHRWIHMKANLNNPKWLHTRCCRCIHPAITHTHTYIYSCVQYIIQYNKHNCMYIYLWCTLVLCCVSKINSTRVIKVNSLMKPHKLSLTGSEKDGRSSPPGVCLSLCSWSLN